MNLSIVIPCFNEQESIPIVIPKTIDILAKLKHQNIIQTYEIIIVDDGSDDQSINQLKLFSDIEILQNSRNLGYGASIKKGIKSATGNYIAIYDMDNTYPPSALPSLIEQISQDNHFTVGYRNHSKSGMPAIRSFGNLFFKKIISFLYKKSIKDPCSGMWVFKKSEVLKFFNLFPNKLQFTLFLSLYLLKNKIPFAEVPISYNERTGVSKLNPIKDGLMFLYLILKFKLQKK